MLNILLCLELGGYLHYRGPLDFVYPVYPIVTPLSAALACAHVHIKLLEVIALSIPNHT